jgi:hypothetical protein
MSEFVDGVKQIMAITSKDPAQGELDASINLEAAKNWGITSIGTVALTLALHKNGVEPAAIAVGGAGAAKSAYHLAQFVNSGRHLAGNVYGKVWGILLAPETEDDQDL